MAAVGLPHRASAVAALYRPFLDGFVLDERDADQAADIETTGLPVLMTDTLPPRGSRRALAAAVLDFAGSLAPIPVG